jgi:hypothetical protein
MNDSKIKTTVLCDTSPLNTMCSFRVQGKVLIEHLLPSVKFVVVDSVALEATANPSHPDT